LFSPVVHSLALEHTSASFKIFFLFFFFFFSFFQFPATGAGAQINEKLENFKASMALCVM